MNNLLVIKGIYTSRQIAEWTGKLHSNIMADIRKEVESLEELGLMIFQLSSYTNQQNKQQPCYTITESNNGTKPDAVRDYREVRIKTRTTDSTAFGGISQKRITAQ
jgi:hypothetical protein